MQQQVSVSDMLRIDTTLVSGLLIYNITGLEADTSKGFVERLSLDVSNLKLLRRGLARAITSGEGSSTPGGSTADLRQVRELAC